MTQPLKIGVVTSEMFGENAYFLWRENASGATADCVVVDPGMDVDKLLAFVEQQNLCVVGILNTHGHADHIAGNAGIKREFSAAPLIIGSGDEPKLTDPVQNLSAGYGASLTSPKADQTVEHGEHLSLAEIDFEVRDTPGHSAGHVVFITESEDSLVVLGGDVLFAGSVGRTDFPDSSFEDLERSIREQLYTLPDNTVILPGHGPPTEIGHEKAHNPFVRLD